MLKRLSTASTYCASSQFFFVYRNDAVNDALIDLLESTVYLGPQHLYGRSSSGASDPPEPSTWFLMHGMITSLTSQVGDQPFSTTATVVSSNGTPGTLAPINAGVINNVSSGRQYIVDVAVVNPAALTYRPKPAPNASGVLIPLPGLSTAFQVRSEPKKSRYYYSTHLCALSRSSSPKPPAACPATLLVLSSSLA